MLINNNPIDRTLEKQQNKRVESDYIEEVGTKFKNYFITTDSSSYIDAYVGEKKPMISLVEVKQKTKIRNPQKQRSHKNYQVLSRLRRMYTLSNSSKLLSFLDENPYLIHVVIEAYGEIKKRFQSETLLLEVVSDSEVDSYDELFAYIQTSLPVEDALNKLNDLDEQWFLNKLDQTKGLFNFNLKFI